MQRVSAEADPETNATLYCAQSKRWLMHPHSIRFQQHSGCIVLYIPLDMTFFKEKALFTH